MRRFLLGIFKTHLYESLTWLTCCEDSLTPGQTTEQEKRLILDLTNIIYHQIRHGLLHKGAE